MAYDPRSNNTSTLKDAISRLLKAYRLNQKYAETEIVQAWGRLMGQPIANRTDQVFMHQKILYVKLNSAPLRHELANSKTKVIEIIKREFGEDAIIDVIFK